MPQRLHAAVRGATLAAMKLPDTLARSSLLQSATEPLNLAAHITWVAIGADLLSNDFGTTRSSVPMSTSVLLFVLFVAALILQFSGRLQGRARDVVLLLQGVTALALIACTRIWSTPILLIILMAQAAAVWPTRALIAWGLVSNLLLYAIIARGGWDRGVFFSVIMQIGFQAFAALMTRYAKAAELRADELRAINGELLATRTLLAEGARDQERLRLSRELHDVAGHKLTALKLNLRALQQQTSGEVGAEVALCTTLADELLGDLRGVVRQMRSDEGIDLARALGALAAPFRKPQIHLHIDPALRIESLELAQTIVRVVQEGITNAVRHADANRIDVDLRQDGARVLLEVRDDGRGAARLREGHGLTGMRERVEEHGGELAIDRSGPGLTLRVWLPA